MREGREQIWTWLCVATWSEVTINIDIPRRTCVHSSRTELGLFAAPPSRLSVLVGREGRLSELGMVLYPIWFRVNRDLITDYANSQIQMLPDVNPGGSIDCAGSCSKLES